MSNAIRKFGPTAAALAVAAIPGAGVAVALEKGAALTAIDLAISSSQRAKGARIAERGIQLSTENAEIIRGWGTWRQGVNIVWPKGPALTEHEHTSSQGKGGQQTENFTYTATFAALVCWKEITRYNVIQLNTTGLYDWNGGSELGMTLVWDDDGFWYGTHENGTKVRAYPGSATQPVDSKIEAVEGVGQWTNYPNCAIIVFEDMPTANGQLPAITIEVYNAVTDVSDIILEVAGWVGYTSDDFDLSAIVGLSVATLDGEGYVADTRKAAAEIIQELCELFHFYLVEEDGVLRAKMKNAPAVKTFTQSDLRIYTPGNPVPDVQFPEADPKNLPAYLEATASDPGRNYQASHVSAPKLLAPSKAIASESWSANLRGNHLLQLEKIRIEQMWAAGRTVTGTLSLEDYLLTPGDGIEIQTEDGFQDFVFKQITYPFFGPGPFNGAGRDIEAFGIALPGDTAGLDKQPPVATGAPIVFVVETAPLSEHRPDMLRDLGFLAGATTLGDSEFGSVVFNIERLQDDGWKEHFEEEVPFKAIIGEFVDDFTPFPPTDGFVPACTATVKLYAKELNSCTLAAAVGGANLMVIRTGLVCSFCNASFVSNDAGQRTYTLDTIKSGRRTTDDFGLGTIAAGTQFMMVTDSEGVQDAAVKWIGLSPTYRGVNTRVRATNPQTTSAPLEPFVGENMSEPKPTVLSITRDGGLRITGRMRTRYPDPSTNVRMSATPYPGGYQYRVTLTVGATQRSWNKIDSDAAGRFDITISDAELTTAFGSVPDPGDIDGTIAIYGSFGPGRAREFESV